MTLLTICQDAAYECNFEAPTTIINNTDSLALQLLRLANKEGKILVSEHDWQALKKEGTITLVTSDQDYALPTDFDRIMSDSTWNRDTKRQVLTPLTSTEWQFLKAWSTVNGLNLRARIRNNEMEFEQTISASLNGETVAFDYISTYWVASAGTGDQETFQADTDTSVLNEELITQGVVWRLKKFKGLADWQQDFVDYKMLRNKMQARDAGSRKIDLGANPNQPVFGINVPEDGFA